MDSGTILAVVLECLDGGFFVKDRLRRYVVATDNFCSLMGIRRDEIVGRRLSEIFRDSGELAMERDDLDVLEGKKARFRYRRPSADGEKILEVVKAPVRDGSGNVTGLAGIVRDVTEQVKLAGDLVQAQRAEALMNLAADIAHDFNNIIYGITGYVTLAMSGMKEDDPALPDLQEVIKATEQAGSYTKRLQSLGRNMPANLKKESMKDLLEGLERLLENTFPDNISVIMKIAPENVPVVMDRGQIERALLNICVNSRDAMRDGGTLTVEVSVVESGCGDFESMNDLITGACCRITIRDTGEGMAPGARERAFEPFYTTRTSGRNMGLGLSIAFGIIKIHGGAITIDPAPGGGTVVEILIPMSGPNGELDGPGAGRNTVPGRRSPE